MEKKEYLNRGSGKRDPSEYKLAFPEGMVFISQSFSRGGKGALEPLNRS
jgi:hypothetical protein